ncbi:MAG: hypothetical protein ABIJ20_02520 [Nanoarchaeota archaeon]|nr:hypothetical protein [Nanoarchaeota archaeon]MBU1444849.1 hypothetical protein [Nanoarchaeota archaeon]MBU2406721.1 hypothetical protein [Nanoarchaeota archaeon]MBU2420320.1 hypothetical protein [Nanoarchaeota archaeon]MBU2475220.1 hypothetical protein [Nanoarchaeota archaeon]
MILAVIFGFVAAGEWLAWTLVVLGIIIGLLNIAEKEVKPFLFAGTVLVIVAALGGGVFENWLKTILDNMLFLFVPATIVVALRSVMVLAKK